MKSEQDPAHILPPLYVIFTLIGAVRRGVMRRNIWREFRRQDIPLQPRLSFWISLCRQTGLLDGKKKQSNISIPCYRLIHLSWFMLDCGLIYFYPMGVECGIGLFIT